MQARHLTGDVPGNVTCPAGPPVDLQSAVHELVFASQLPSIGLFRSVYRLGGPTIARYFTIWIAALSVIAWQPHESRSARRWRAVTSGKRIGAATRA